MEKGKLELQKHTMLLVKGDFETLKILYPQVQPSVIIRTLIHQHIETIQGQHQPVKVEVNLD